MRIGKKFGRLMGRIRSRIVVRIICICALSASVLIVLQGSVIGIYVTRHQERQAIEGSYQILSVAEGYFTDLYNKLKTYNAQMYEEKLVREQVQEYVRKGAGNSPGDRIKFQNLLNEQLKKQFGNDYGALMEADYYDLSAEMLIPFYWTEETFGRKEYVAPAIESARESVRRGAARQRIYELAIFADRTEESTFTLYDFIRDPDDLTRIAGALMFHFAVDGISDKIWSMGFDDALEVLLVSQNGELCYDTYHDFEKASKALEELTLSTGVYLDSGVSIVRFNNRFGFYVVSRIGEDALYGPVRQMSLFIIVCTLSALALLAAVLLWCERRTSGRMRRLAENIAKIEAGRLDVVLQETSHQDEVDILSHKLNEMQKRLAYQLEQEKKNMERTKQLELLQKDAEFYALQAQIKPHFLYNILEVIRMRAVTEHARDTAVMTRLLADVLRENVSRQTMVTIAEAVNYCEKYVELFSYRFGGELIVDFQVEQEARRFIVPTYVIQPVLENALVHGLRPNQENPCLELHVRLDGSTIRMRVQDNGCGMKEEALACLREKIEHCDDTVQSIGLANVNHRLRMLFGEEFGVTVESNPGEGTRVDMWIPALKPDEWGKYV